jgi:putative phosphoribosyl transferase
MIFQNRKEAGRLLAAQLDRYRRHPVGVVLALPRGGVVVGFYISQALHLPLDVFITRKIGAPENPEYALGALSETGNLYVNPDAITEYQLSQQDLEELLRIQREEIDRRRRLYRGGRPLLSLKDRLVILVDDGLATGATFLASAEAIRQQAPHALVAAIPVGPEETIKKVEALVDDLVVLDAPDPFWSVGRHYVEFRQVTDEEVITYLKSAASGDGEQIAYGV